jgi:hypothetical protein
MPQNLATSLVLSHLHCYAEYYPIICSLQHYLYLLSPSKDFKVNPGMMDNEIITNA